MDDAVHPTICNFKVQLITNSHTDNWLIDMLLYEIRNRSKLKLNL